MAAASPPEPHNFTRLPTVRGREPIWEDPATTPVVTGLATDTREVLVTTPHDAQPHFREFLAAMAARHPGVAASVAAALGNVDLAALHAPPDPSAVPGAAGPVAHAEPIGQDGDAAAPATAATTTVSD